MAFRKKCPVCNSCMSPMHHDNERYMYCGFCRQYYTGQIDHLYPVDSPFQPVIIPDRNNWSVEDPKEEE